MASSGQSITISYMAWNTSTNAGQTGDVANHTLRWVKDGTSAAPTNAAAEVDSVNAPGVYKLTLTTAECTCNSGILCGKSSTANVAIMPISITFEQLPTAAPGANTGLPIVGTQVPNATAGASGGLPTLNSALNVAADLQTIKTQTVTCAAGVTILANVGTATHALVVDASGFVNVATNNDKTGYSLSVAPPTSAQIATAVWTDLLASSDFSTASSIGALLKTDIDAAVSSRMATFTLPTNFSALAITAGGAVTAGTVSDKTGYSLTQAFPANFAALGISAGGHISNVDTVATLTTYTGNTPQTGDAFARLGAPAGTSVSADVAAVKASVGSPQQAGSAVTLPANPPTGFLVAGSFAASSITDAAFAVPAEPTGPANGVLSRLDQLWRRFIGNKATQTATQLKMYKSDGTTVVSTQTLSDDGTTQTQTGGV